MDINLGRGNANKIMNTLLLMSAEKFGLRVADIQGGSLRNAIPRESFVKAIVPSQNAEKFLQYVKEYEEIVKEEFSEADPDVCVTAEPCAMPEKASINQRLAKLFAFAQTRSPLVGVTSPLFSRGRNSSPPGISWRSQVSL